MARWVRGGERGKRNLHCPLCGDELTVENRAQGGYRGVCWDCVYSGKLMRHRKETGQGSTQHARNRVGYRNRLESDPDYNRRRSLINRSRRIFADDPYEAANARLDAAYPNLDNLPESWPDGLVELQILVIHAEELKRIVRMQVKCQRIWEIYCMISWLRGMGLDWRK